MSLMGGSARLVTNTRLSVQPESCEPTASVFYYLGTRRALKETIIYFDYPLSGADAIVYDALYVLISSQVQT